MYFWSQASILSIAASIVSLVQAWRAATNNLIVWTALLYAWNFQTALYALIRDEVCSQCNCFHFVCFSVELHIYLLIGWIERLFITNVDYIHLAESQNSLHTDSSSYVTMRLAQYSRVSIETAIRDNFSNPKNKFYNWSNTSSQDPVAENKKWIKSMHGYT